MTCLIEIFLLMASEKAFREKIYGSIQTEKSQKTDLIFFWPFIEGIRHLGRFQYLHKVA